MKEEAEDFTAKLAGDEVQDAGNKQSWFRRIHKGITTSTKDKKEAPDGLWTKCPNCRFTSTISELRENLFVCSKCDYHHRIGSTEYFEFIGGSLGSVMGEKIRRACDYCIEHHIPLLIINKSGGARMMESAFSLMQLAKTAGSLSLLSDAKVPYFSLCTDPTFGGTTASFAMLGDIIMGEPGALIGFAGPRVIKETIKKDLPPGFQRSEFLLEHGFLDFIISRKELKERLSQLITLFQQ
jgi:acetyl-CoA carboxylase beta subunit